MSGWDFSELKGRWIEESPPWNFRDMVFDKMAHANSLLDLGTGGGEFLSSLRPLPEHSFCTEGYAPNVPVAKKRLETLGVEVVQTYCDDNNVPNQRGALPFRSESLDLIIDRHESFIASEVFRVLKKNGVFLTQQVGSRNLLELNDLLGASRYETVWDFEECKRQIELSGFKIIRSEDAKMNSWFKDVGAIVCFLLSAPWQIPGFDIDKYLPRLKELHERIEKEGSLRATATRFYVNAIKR